MVQTRDLRVPFTLLGLTLIVYPLLEVLISSWPVKFGLAAWRFSIEGMLAGSLFFVLIGALLLLCAAYVSESAGRMRVAYWMSVAASVALIVIMGMFALDMIQVYATVKPPMRPSFVRATVTTAFLDVLGLLTFLGMAWAARRATRAVRPARAHTPESSLIARAAPARPAGATPPE